jgi:hypothetical protein
MSGAEPVRANLNDDIELTLAGDRLRRLRDEGGDADWAAWARRYGDAALTLLREQEREIERLDPDEYWDEPGFGRVGSQNRRTKDREACGHALQAVREAKAATDGRGDVVTPHLLQTAADKLTAALRTRDGL